VQVIDDDHQRPLRRPPPHVGRRQVIGAEADRGLIAQDAAAPLLGDAGKRSKIMMSSAGPSMAVKACGVMVANSAASPV
jgi:hypothetical protein